MRCPISTALVASAMAVLAGAPVLFAQESGGAEPPLAGPKVEPARATARTLVQRDFAGKLKRLEGDPVAAALDLLELDKQTRAAADKVLADRAAALDVLMRDNLKEVTELAAARQAGDQAAARQHLRDLLSKAGPMFTKGPLVDQVAQALPADRATELKRLVEEYVQAGIDDRLENGAAEMPPAGKNGGHGTARPTRAQANLAERLTGFGAEVRRSYERVFGERATEFRELVKDLGLSPEQESRVQQIFTDLFQKTYGKPTRTQSTHAFLEAYALMDADQRTRLRERLAGRQAQGEKRDAPQAVPTPK